jgi:Protein of unknown function (DUF2950)
MFSSKKSGLKSSLLAVPLTACMQLAQAQQPVQRTFASAEDASQALFVAVQSNETGAIAQILGQGDELTHSSDPRQDRLERSQFVSKYREMHRLARKHADEVVLYIGAENWPFPIPLTSDHGVWHYDTDTGRQEVLFRRIGENEVAAIETCHALVASLKSPDSARGGDMSAPYRGYTFRILPAGGARAIVAYPTQYGTSGVMTFVVSEQGAVYQKDLGTDTEKVATGMASYQHDSTWTPAETGLGDPR